MDIGFNYETRFLWDFFRSLTSSASFGTRYVFRMMRPEADGFIETVKQASPDAFISQNPRDKGLIFVETPSSQEPNSKGANVTWLNRAGIQDFQAPRAGERVLGLSTHPFHTKGNVGGIIADNPTFQADCKPGAAFFIEPKTKTPQPIRWTLSHQKTRNFMDRLKTASEPNPELVLPARKRRKKPTTA